MSDLAECVLQIPEPMWEEVRAYRESVERYLAGDLDEVRFRARRVPMGIYEQRNGGCMVRVRIGAGLILPDQLRAVAATARAFGPVHVTTRQDLQIHDVPVEATPGVLDQLMQAGLSTRGGGGNTVRNVTASARSGVDPDEAFDVRPYAIATTESLLNQPASYNLPRKYKIAFSAGPGDDAFASVTDLGFVAHVSGDTRCFRVFTAGGLGAHSRAGLQILEALPAEQAPLAAEAVRRIFDRHGDRTNRHAARLRFVLERLGEERFREECLAEIRLLAETKQSVLPTPRSFPEPWRKTLRPGAGSMPPQTGRLLPEGLAGFYTVVINPRHGLINSDALEQIADLAEQHGEGLIRTTQQQELLLCGVPGGRVAAVHKSLLHLGEEVYAPDRATAVACAGAATCKLGLCLSRGLTTAIQDRCRGQNLPSIRISGCPNSCGSHQIAALGFSGKARRVDGRLMPYYDVWIGGKASPEGATLGERIGALPARAVPEFVSRAAAHPDIQPQIMRSILQELEALPEPVPELWFLDWGSDVPFTLAGRGPGECGTGTRDIIKMDIDGARQHLADAQTSTGNDRNAALYEATLAAARSLLPIFGQEPRTAEHVLRDFDERLIRTGWVAPSARTLIHAAQDWKANERASLEDLGGGLLSLLDRIERLFASLDSSLSFRLEPYRQESVPHEMTAKSSQACPLDLRGVGCPLNFVRVKIALEAVPVGEALDVLLDLGEPARNVPESLRAQGQEVTVLEERDDHVRLRVCRLR